MAEEVLDPVCKEEEEELDEPEEVWIRIIAGTLSQYHGGPLSEGKIVQAFYQSRLEVKGAVYLHIGPDGTWYCVVRGYTQYVLGDPDKLPWISPNQTPPR